MPKSKEVEEINVVSSQEEAPAWRLPEEEALQAEVQLAQVFQSLAERTATPDLSLIKELIKKLAPDLLLIIRVDSDTQEATPIYVQSRYGRELPNEEVYQLLEKEKQRRHEPRTFWNRLLRPDIIAPDQHDPIGMSQALAAFTFSFAIDKVVDPQQRTVFLILKGTEMPTPEIEPHPQMSPKELRESVWSLVGRLSEIENKHQDFLTQSQDTRLWFDNVHLALRYFLDLFGMKMHAAEKYRQAGRVDLAQERTREAMEMLGRLHQLYGAMPKLQETKDVPRLK